MAFMRTEKWCCCFLPKTGIVTLAILAIIASIIDAFLLMTTSGSGTFKPEGNYGMVFSEEVWQILAILFMLVDIVNMVLAQPLLLMGLSHDQPSLMVPSLYMCVVHILRMITKLFVVCIKPDENPYRNFFEFSIASITIIFVLHCYSIIYYYRKDLRSRNSERPTQQVTYRSRV